MREQSEIEKAELKSLIVRRLGLASLICGLILVCAPLIPLEAAVSPLVKWVTGGQQAVSGLSSSSRATLYLGAVAPLWFFSALMFLYSALMEQRLHLRAQRESLDILRSQVDEQREASIRQTREAKGQYLFELMRWHNEMVNTFGMTRGVGDSARIISGKECLRLKYRDFVDEGYRKLFAEDPQFRERYEAEIESVKRALDEQENEAVHGPEVRERAGDNHGTNEAVPLPDTPMPTSTVTTGRRESRWEKIEEMREEAFNRALDDYFQEAGREREFIRKRYLEFYEANEAVLGNYFRSLLDILKGIHGSGLPEESLYAGMLKRQLIGEELALIFYHVQAMGRDELGTLAKRYDLFENLSYGILHPRFKRLLGLSPRRA